MINSFNDRVFDILSKAWDKLPQLLLTLVVGYIIIKIVRAILGSLIKVTRAKIALKQIILSVIDIALWMFLIATILSQIGLPQIALALSGFVAIAGLAISQGTSSLIQDLVAGIFLAQDVDFNVGDTIKINDVEGVIEKMDARKVRVRNKEGNLHVFPNSVFDRAAWVVQKRKGEK